MTTEQMALVKKLIQKHEIEATDAEWTLIFMGVGYGLSEQQIDSYLVMDTTDLLVKHEKMLCILLGMDAEMQGATNEIQNPAERIQFMLENHFQRKKSESGYASVMQYVIEDSDLSAAQIEQLRKAIEAGMPAEDILEMAKKRKDVMEIQRCIEFYEMMQQKGKQENVKKNGKTKSNLFIIIPDDDDTFNFVPGMVYTLLFQEMYRQARSFGGKLPMDVGFWLDEMANIKMLNNFDKILATCRSRGVYCVPILQSLAQLKTLLADGAWEGIVGNCDTFIYLGGNEASTYEYVSKLLGKWTINKRTSGESKGTSGSYSENYDVLGRELMLEYELRLLPDDECIIFVRGENPIRDKKWFPWEHEAYLEARKCGVFVPAVQKEKQKQQMEECDFIAKESLKYLKNSNRKMKTSGCMNWTPFPL